MDKFTKKILVSVLLLNPLFSMADKDEIESPVLPKKSWGQLVEQLGPYTLSAKELRVTDCPQEITDEKKVAGSYQHIMFNDYLWDVYKLENGLNCIKLIEPEIGLLTADEAKILLSASRGYGFGKGGFREEIKLFVENHEKNMPECIEEDNVSDDNKFNMSENSLLLDIEWNNENYVPYTDEEQRLIDSHSIDSHFTSDSSKSKLATQYKNSEDINSSAHLGCLKKPTKIKFINSTFGIGTAYKLKLLK